MPFKIHGVVHRPDFTDRDMEVARIRATLSEPGAKLLVHGPRRMGKTSALRVAMNDHLEAGGMACIADFSTATSHADLSNRVLTAATAALGRRWRDSIQDLAGRIGVKLEMGIDPTTGLPTASIGLGARTSPESERETLARVLDSIEGLCGERDTSLGLILDEFQEINRLGGEEAEWHLRGIIQNHHHVSYVAAGSRTHLIHRMIGEGAAFYKLFDLLPFGPIQPAHLSAWIDEELTAAGIRHGGLGAYLLELAGERTRDVAQLARRTYILSRPDERATIETVREAFLEIVVEESDPLRALWANYSATQENVLRAVAAGSDSLTSADTLHRFRLRSSAAATQAAAALVEQGALVQERPGQYRFDSPYQRGWVIQHALPDVGLHLPITHPFA